MEYVSVEEAHKALGVCKRTLKNYAKLGKIDFITTDSGWRKYNIRKYLTEHNKNTKKKVCYCRVSSSDRKDDLKRQVKSLINKYPTHEIITDIGSGINFKRKGLQKIIEMAINNELDELVVTYKDRLCRIGYDLLEFIFKKYSRTNIIIENGDKKNINEEITNDLIEIITVYSSKIYGARSHKNKKLMIPSNS